MGGLNGYKEVRGEGGEGRERKVELLGVGGGKVEWVSGEEEEG